MAASAIYLDGQMAERVRQVAEARQQTPADLVQQVVAHYVEHEESDARFRQEVLRRWERYQTTGLHVTGEKADAWLKRLANGEDVPRPICHT